jgi:cytochrome P450
VHRCIGAAFARIQIGAAFGELFDRITNVRIEDGTEITYHYGMSRSPTAVHLVFDRR